MHPEASQDRRGLLAGPTHIVLSSTWRFVPGLEKTVSDKLQEFGLKIESSTDTQGDHRGMQIKRWLAARGLENARFVILDDDSDMLPEQLPFFVQTSMKGGLMDHHMEKAIEILKSD